MKIEISKDWCATMAQLEADTEIGAGILAIDPVFDGEVMPVAVAPEDCKAPVLCRYKRRAEMLQCHRCGVSLPPIQAMIGGDVSGQSLHWRMVNPCPGAAAHLGQTEMVPMCAKCDPSTPTEIEILRAQVELLRDAHDLANEALRSAWSIAEREGRETNWPGHRAQLRASLDASFAAMKCLRSMPVQKPNHPPIGNVK